jgi:hypothetical protein
VENLILKREKTDKRTVTMFRSYDHFQAEDCRTLYIYILLESLYIFPFGACFITNFHCIFPLKSIRNRMVSDFT